MARRNYRKKIKWASVAIIAGAVIVGAFKADWVKEMVGKVPGANDLLNKL